MTGRRMGDFVPVGEVDRCLCGHDYFQHSDGVTCNAFETVAEDDVFVNGVPCGCEEFTDDDPDGDYVPGIDDDDVP